MDIEILVAIISILLGIFLYVWFAPRGEIDSLKRENETLKINHKKEVERLQFKIDLFENRTKNQEDLNIIFKGEFLDAITLFAYDDIVNIYRKEYPNIYIPKYRDNDKRVVKVIKEKVREAIDSHYKYEYLISLYPELSENFDGTKINTIASMIGTENSYLFKEISKDSSVVSLLQISNSEKYKPIMGILMDKIHILEQEISKAKNLQCNSNKIINTEVNKIQRECDKKNIVIQQQAKEEITEIQQQCKQRINKITKANDDFINNCKSNLSAIPYMAQIIADYETIGLEELANKLDWGRSYERLKKVKSIKEIRKDARTMVEKNKEAQYQLAYLLELFPNLQDVIECEFSQLPPITVNELSDYDATKDYLSKEEYLSLSITERNQLALDRYKNSHNKSKWQIGRDYELYIGYVYERKGYQVEYFGSEQKLKDLGRDLICKKDDETLIVQCKYWSSIKEIHEKHITQLYGTTISYCIENNLKKSDVKAVLVTNIALSDMAKKMSKMLRVKYEENIPLKDYPCIKCNISNDGTKIYHLPFDQSYDVTKIDKKGEFLARTVKEAENAGFRRAYKWFGSN